MQRVGWRGGHPHTRDGCGTGAPGNELPLPSAFPQREGPCARRALVPGHQSAISGLLAFGGPLSL